MRVNLPFQRMNGVLKFATKLLAAVAAAVVLFVVYEVIENPEASGPVYLALLNMNILLAAGLLVYVGRRLMLIFLERKRGMTGARLHVRLLGIFSLLAVLPALVVTIFSVTLINQGMESWFSDRVTKALDRSRDVAQAYLEEHGSRLMSEAKNIAREPTVRVPGFIIDVETVRDMLEFEREELNMSEIAIYTRLGDLVVSAGGIASAPSYEMLQAFSVTPPRPLLLTQFAEGKLTAIVPMKDDMFLVASRWVNPSVLANLDDQRAAYQEYYKLRSERGTLQLLFTLVMLVLSAMCLAWAVWAGLKLARRIVGPVTALVHATNKVATNNYDVRVEPLDDDELGILTQAFNRMTRLLKENRELLEKKNRELDDRRRMIEAVLTGVTAGVISVDEKGIVHVANSVAKEYLHLYAGARLVDASLELHTFFKDFMATGYSIMERQVKIVGENGARTLLVRMVPQRLGTKGVKSVVVTFDDISPLISAQKTAAWSDVARRLAHEIKNPLTPIQLSAERLRRKFGKQVPEEEQTLFAELTATIVGRTEDMRSMLNEFSDFARMPSAVFKGEDLVKIIQEVLVLQRTARPQIDFVFDCAQPHIVYRCDRMQISRALTNLVENAVNAIEEKPDEQKLSSKGEREQVKVVVKMSQADTLTITIYDTGRGLPAGVETENLFDPYVTTREKGTGLGLAIVRRVLEEHGGQVRLANRKNVRGACVEISLPLRKTEE